MDLSKAKKSKNFKDKTGYTEGQKQIDKWLTLLNPMVADRSISSWLVEKGIFNEGKGNKAGLHPQNIKLEQAPASANFEDKTNYLTPGVDWKTRMFLELVQQKLKDGVRADGSYTLEDPKRFPKPSILKR